MRNDWPKFTTATLIESGALEIGDGYRAKNSEMSTQGLPFIRAGDVNGRVNTIGTDILSRESVQKAGPKISLPGDVVITTKGTVGRLAIVRSDDPMFVYSPQLCYWRSRDPGRLHPGWLFYALQSEEFVHQMRWSAGQTDMAPYMSLTDQRTFFKLTVPPLPEQRAIAATLGALDDKIELNRKMNATLEAMARALFRDWFVDFGPTRAKMAQSASGAKNANDARAPTLSPDLWSLFPDRLDDEGKPEGWEVRPVGDFSELKGGKQLEKEHITDTGPVPVFGGAGLMGYTANHNADGFVISVGRVGAYCGQFFSHRGKAWINNNASLIRPNADVSGEWLLIALRHIDMDVIKKGAAQPFVSNGDIAKVGIVWPGDAIIKAFADALVSLMKKSEANERESRTLAQTRDLLLPRLMSGALRVAGAERRLENIV